MLLDEKESFNNKAKVIIKDFEISVNLVQDMRYNWVLD